MDIFSLIGAVSTARPISIHVVMIEINIPSPAKRNDIVSLFSRRILFLKIEKQK